MLITEDKVEQGQSFIDLVCQQSGTYDEVLKSALLNNKSISSTVEIGETIMSSAIIDQSVVSVLNKQKPATELKKSSDAIPELEGISYWIINKTFVVQ